MRMSDRLRAAEVVCEKIAAEYMRDGKHPLENEILNWMEIRNLTTKTKCCENPELHSGNGQHGKPVMLTHNGKTFRCHCGANVFHQPDCRIPGKYECNGCGEAY